jgi:outer membrane protein, multidrug efflux system
VRTRDSTWRMAVIALTMAVSIAGCTVGPEYRRPQVTIDRQFRSQLSPSEANSIADLPWWKVFNDKALQGLIAEALANNYDVQIAVARVEQARAQLGIARADLYPQIGYNATAARQKAFIPELGGQEGNSTFNSFGTFLSATWELDLWGRIRRATEAARASLLAQEDVRRGVMLSLVSNVATGYFQLIELDRELEIAKDSAATYKRTLDLFTLRFNTGRDSKLAVVRAQAAYDSSTATIAILTRAITQTENALSVLLGANPRAIERGSRLVDQVMPDTPLGLTTDLLERRPDILQAEHVMMGANAEIGVAIAEFFPRVGLSALFGGQGVRVEDIVKRNSSIWSIGADLTGPIFQGGRLRANYYASQAFWDQTIASYKKTIVVAFQDTSDALIAQQTLVGQRSAQQDQVNALRESVDLSLTRYDAGRASYFEVLDAEQLLFPTEDTLAQTQRDQLLAVVNLYKALGGGWNLQDAQWTAPAP